jgi:plasmid stabilization system protein ParE
MQVAFTPQALEEIAQSALYYERKQRGLGTEYTEEVYEFVQILATVPEQPRLRRRGYRRVNLDRFPYYIAYSIEAGVVLILAIGHAARSPEYWIERKP